jgi:hypothetical protein
MRRITTEHLVDAARRLSHRFASSASAVELNVAGPAASQGGKENLEALRQKLAAGPALTKPCDRIQMKHCFLNCYDTVHGVHYRYPIVTLRGSPLKVRLIPGIASAVHVLGFHHVYQYMVD